ncbi:ArsC/Spx/MgsR family protein [Vibrio nitrifigilis]|uniref:Arsenate reductase family protein n=1 Tax=Vibrio nitrifigilis TaxID=2789781 RepID=A0ABS0GEP8_9VIBR|nr:ArsC/Spx/MgsR family protein [Vibrio nitrifigilis]MBF9000852.1 arsenate reductase family protein [Vibrio nitrifigilis]
MAHIHFFQKPGCINNGKQVKLLKAAGHDVIEDDLLTHVWSVEILKTFFGSQPLSACFNQQAPAIKSQELDPTKLTDEQALELMVNHPILIKRPLMIINEEHFIQGFDQNMLAELIGLEPMHGKETVVQNLRQQDLEHCPNDKNITTCD